MNNILELAYDELAALEQEARNDTRMVPPRMFIPMSDAEIEQQAEYAREADWRALLRYLRSKGVDVPDAPTVTWYDDSVSLRRVFTVEV